MMHHSLDLALCMCLCVVACRCVYMKLIMDSSVHNFHVCPCWTLTKSTHECIGATFGSQPQSPITRKGASPALSLVGNRIRTAGGVGHRAPFPGSLQARKETHPSLGPLPTYFSGSPTSIEKNVLNARQVAASKLGQAAGSRRLLCQLPWLNFGRRTARCEPTSLR